MQGDENIVVERIAHDLQLKSSVVRRTLALMADGATIPFIARYRKEVTQAMDEVLLKRLRDLHQKIIQVNKRRSYIKELLHKQKLLRPELVKALDNADELTELEDLFLPFKPKRLTRAGKARKLGLAPLAELIWSQNDAKWSTSLKKLIPSDLKQMQAIEGAKDILAERIAEFAWVRSRIRQAFIHHAVIQSRVVKKKESEAMQFRDYFDHSEKINRCPSHRYLAITRGEQKGFLRVSLLMDDQRILQPIRRKLIRPTRSTQQMLHDVIDDAYKRLIRPSIEKEVRHHYKDLADEQAITLFGSNLRQLLLEPPLGQKNVLAIDPGFRSGCKVVVLDHLGQLKDYQTIFPHPPQAQKEKAIAVIRKVLANHRIEAIAIGNGTAGRETLEFIRKAKTQLQDQNCYLVSEQGASVYSASDIARTEFPDLDLAYRGAISIGRRLMDPLAELIKLDPKVIGVGQYQHDVNQKKLQSELDFVVEACVNLVGVNLNTASPQLLTYVSGIGKAVANNIVTLRNRQGAFNDRRELLQVKGFGEKMFEQAAGFLRIRNGRHPFDATGIHPESYSLALKICEAANLSIDNLRNSSNLESVNPSSFIDNRFGLHTIRDIIKELKKPGLDPRGKAAPTPFYEQIRALEDLSVGMKLPGQVTNLTHFGAFVDLGLKESGLIHKSKLGHGQKDPQAVLRIHQRVVVEVLEIDPIRRRIQLKLIEQQ